MPIENSSSGTLHRVYDMLLASSLYIMGECAFIEEHCLCAKHGVKEEVRGSHVEAGNIKV